VCTMRRRLSQISEMFETFTGTRVHRWIVAPLLAIGAVAYIWTDLADRWTPKPPAVEISGTPSRSELALVNDAFTLLVEACPGIKRQADVIDRIEATIIHDNTWGSEIGAPDFRYERYGWRSYVRFLVQTSKTKALVGHGMPSLTELPRRTYGETLYYNVGIGGRPGYLARKDWSKWLCDIPVRPGEGDKFVPVPGVTELEPYANILQRTDF
ncbi:MAG: hypothetical protein ACOC91_03150, partial [bacterium]